MLIAVNRGIKSSMLNVYVRNREELRISVYLNGTNIIIGAASPLEVYLAYVELDRVFSCRF